WFSLRPPEPPRHHHPPLAPPPSLREPPRSRPIFLRVVSPIQQSRGRSVRWVAPQFCLYLPLYFLGSPLPKAFGKLKPIAISSDNFRFFSFCSHGSMSRARVSQRRGYKSLMR